MSEADVDAVQKTVRGRVLALFERRGLLTPEVTADMLQWEHGGGFSLDARIRVDASDRAGLERLLRYCARPAFARQRLSWEESNQQLVYELPKPAPVAQGLFDDLPVWLAGAELPSTLTLTATFRSSLGVGGHLCGRSHPR